MSTELTLKATYYSHTLMYIFALVFFAGVIISIIIDMQMIGLWISMISGVCLFFAYLARKFYSKKAKKENGQRIDYYA
jgi:positive regulator of sigma E activity